MDTTSFCLRERRCCGTCASYRQHYVLNKENCFIPIWYGHCISSEIKEQEPDAVCPDWTAAILFDSSPSEEYSGNIRSYPIRMKWE